MIFSTLRHHRVVRITAVVLRYLIGNASEALYNAALDMLNSPEMRRMAHRFALMGWEIIKLHFNLNFGRRTA
jgi:hypothetical protein